MTVNPFRHPPGPGVDGGGGGHRRGVHLLSFDRRVFRRAPELDGRQGHVLALTLALATAPWLFFVPVYL